MSAAARAREDIQARRASSPLELERVELVELVVYWAHRGAL
jgi:hypothetical protein